MPRATSHCHFGRVLLLVNGQPGAESLDWQILQHLAGEAAQYLLEAAFAAWAWLFDASLFTLLLLGLAAHAVNKKLTEDGRRPASVVTAIVFLGVCVVDDASLNDVQHYLTEAGCDAYPVGKIVKGDQSVEYHGSIGW